ncbi:16S rRNA (guanine(527)-N(7))-methyltransferase RsmG [Massilia forsythiae]|uniref:Ribosomal RNA small subunit methyltransferase G n=1 Tax=Massilia forsythiae TaxID=2728020 RepID=A0A7Z2VW12_9BURK|nr:16S rRNA (guanine(527)-N(7))-methyltransferase RsmG [Massilia forsythiae]QJD99976.1 16S rRNA (guanine(527)-N(7))-methyltransferase RsmG [Massilia forsythiae]
MKHFDREALQRLLEEGIGELDLQVSTAQRTQLMDYLALMFKWNSVYNLTSLRDPLQMVTHHLLDSLAAVPAFDGASNILDVGSGGGLPGIVLAITRPDVKVAMIDTVHKKTAFLTQVKAELGLMNATVYTMRVEQLQVSEKFDVITSRAFADLSDFVDWSGHLLAEGGRYIALKGVAPEDERQRLPAQWKVTGVQALQVPRLEAERHLVFIERQA